MKKKIIICIVVIFLITVLCIVGITLNNDMQDNLVNEFSEENAEIYTPTWQEDANKSEIVTIMNNFNTSRPYNLEYVVEKMESQKENNLYAKMFIETYNSTNYQNLDEVSKDFLNLYIKELFDKENKTAYNTKSSKLLEAWKGNYNNEVSGFGKRLIVKFEDYPYQLTYEGASTSYLVLSKKYKDDIVNYELDTQYYSNPIASNPEMNVKNNKGSFICEQINVEDLNKILNEYEPLINIIIDYRDEVYKPIQQELEEKAKEEKEKLNEQKKRKPSVGMTKTEVNNSAWGEPDKINKDTYSWGTTEQWVYNDKGYVYFKNGIVTSVSER